MNAEEGRGGHLLPAKHWASYLIGLQFLYRLHLSACTHSEAWLGNIPVASKDYSAKIKANVLVRLYTTSGIKAQQSSSTISGY